MIKQLREDFDGQGDFETIYKRHFETQTTCGESQDDKSPVFCGYASEIGLDMTGHERDVVSEDVAARVEADFVDAQSLALSGTPSLYLDGETLQPRTVADFIEALENAGTPE